MKILKSPIRAWRKGNFDRMDNKIADLEVVILELEKKGERTQLDNMELARLNAAHNALQQWLIRRERVWRQRARSYGFNGKDHNTKFFHAAANFKRKQKEFIQIKINGRIIVGKENLKEEVRGFFVNRFKQA